MSSYVLSKLALKEVDAIWLYIAEDSVDAAERWATKLERAFLMIGSTPGVGRTRIDLMPFPVQVWPLGEYFILYRTTKRGVQITSVSHGARDLPTYLRDR